MSAASFLSSSCGDAGSHSSGMSQAMWYCFAVDRAKTTADAVNRLWCRRHRGAWHRVFRVRDTADHAVMQQATIDHGAWWQRYGAGFVVIRPGEDALDRAVFGFLLEHASKFSALWYGAVSRSPLDRSLLDHMLIGHGHQHRGEAA